MSDVFTSGQEGYASFRIPAIVRTQKGTLLAFAEGRVRPRDHAENDLVLKRSEDLGATWSPLQVLQDAGADALNNPTAVVVGRSGRILLMYQRYAAGFDEHKAEPGYEGPHVCRSFLIYSDDDGRTWSEPREVTREVKRPEKVTSTAAGPGIGIQLEGGPHSGRILIPFNQGPYGHWEVYAAISDDEGRTWRYGKPAPEGSPGHANEVQFVELKDGSVMLNARNQGGGKRRKIAISHDGGENWSETRDDAALIEPVCQASLIRDPGTGDLVFSNPAAQNARTNGTIRVSHDEGRTWAASRIICPGGFAYSCLVPLPGDAVGCLFERDNYAKISFICVPLKKIREGE